MTEPVRLCFVCLGNICRSPTAEGVMRHLVNRAGLADHIEVDSAGTAGWHTGDAPDRRATVEAATRGIDLSRLRGRQFHTGDLAWFDLVLAMDESNRTDLRDLATTPAERAKIHLLRAFDPASDGDGLDVPDPYYGGPDGFRQVFDLLEAACTGLLAHIAADVG